MVERTRHIVRCVGLFGLIVLAALLMHHRVSVTDSDARCYIEGAYSLHAGTGYRDLTGERLNHWPPGYSWLLSLFPHPLQAALAINYLSLGVAVSCIYLLTQRAGWHYLASSGVALALGFGFFRSIATNAKPDMLTYGLFLVGAQCLAGASGRLRTLGACIWSTLIPLKLIAVVFAPATLLVDWLVLRGRPHSFRSVHCGIILGIWLVALTAVVGFNYYTIKVIVPASHGAGSLSSFPSEIIRFLKFSARGFLANWYGSIETIAVWLPFSLTLITGVVSLITLRPYVEGRRYAYLGLAVLGLSWVLELIRWFYADLRLMGYGLLILLLAYRPRVGAEKAWLTYACATILLAVANVLTTNSLGVNDPRYARLAADVLAAHPPRDPIFSNSYHILDIHERLPSIPVESLEAVPPGAIFLKVDLPNYDAIQRTVWRIAEPPREWTTMARWQNATLYAKPAERLK